VVLTLLQPIPLALKKANSVLLSVAITPSTFI
jgi:hypothetical protein